MSTKLANLKLKNTTLLEFIKEGEVVSRITIRHLDHGVEFFNETINRPISGRELETLLKIYELVIYTPDYKSGTNIRFIFRGNFYIGKAA